MTKVYNGPNIGEKTLVSVLTLNDLSNPKPAGSALTLDAITADNFDALVFGEQTASEWMNGSSGFSRTRNANGIKETQTGKLLIIAATYKNVNGQSSIALYRNGQLLKSCVKGPFTTWKAGNTKVNFGCRHIIPNGTVVRSYLPGTILAAAIYPRALDESEIKNDRVR